MGECGAVDCGWAARGPGAQLGLWMGGTRFWRGPAEFGVAQELGARSWGHAARSWSWSPRTLDGWHAGLDGWRAAGTVCLDGRHMAQSWGPAWGLDGWRARGHAAQELGACGVWMGGTRLWSRAPAVLMHVPGTFNRWIVRRLGHSMYSYLLNLTIEASRLIAKLETMVVTFSIRATTVFFHMCHQTEQN